MFLFYYKRADGSVYASDRPAKENVSDIEIPQSEGASLILSEGAATKIRAEIASLDVRRIRPLAEGDTAYLADLNAQMAALRARLL